MVLKNNFGKDEEEKKCLKTRSLDSNSSSSPKKDKRMKLQDYSKTREVIEFPKFYSANETKNQNFSKHALMIYIPDKLRRELKMSHYNQSEFKVIICRKSALKDKGVVLK